MNPAAELAKQKWKTLNKKEKEKHIKKMSEARWPKPVDTDLAQGNE